VVAISLRNINPLDEYTESYPMNEHYPEIVTKLTQEMDLWQKAPVALINWLSPDIHLNRNQIFYLGFLR